MNSKKITVVGSGYVGMSMAVLLAQHNEVTALDINENRVELINKRKSTVVDADIEQFLGEKELSLSATLDEKQAYAGAEFIVIATPTNYDSETNHFDTSSVESVIGQAFEYNQTAMIVIKSTIAGWFH